MRATLVLISAILVIAFTDSARGGRNDWMGSAKCGSCHQAQLAAWKLTPHATTAKRFGNAKPETRCLACHGTGEAPAGPAIAVEVGCESCHGAGAAYGEDDIMRNPTVSRALGLVDVSAKGRPTVCAQCHIRPLRGKVFDPTAPVHPVAKP